jgi:FAD:protein FMN transferase
MARAKTILTAVVGAAMLVILTLVVLGLWQTHREDPPLLMQTYRRPTVMDTEFTISLVVDLEHQQRVEDILATADAAARGVADLMNVHNPASELSRFNDAPAGRLVTLTPMTLEALDLSQRYWDETDGAFDVTIRPLILLWQETGRSGTLPGRGELLAARNASRWAYLELFDTGVRKTVPTAAVDLGGMAKGFAIDRATDSALAAGCLGGVVDIGGDVRVFGRKPSDTPWRVGIADPFQPDCGQTFVRIALPAGAVCTSGNYRRYSVIGEKRFSHIIDPRTGMPVDACPSVTVVAPLARTADAWATALSVLGPEGLKKLTGTGIEAMLVVGEPDDYRVEMTPGFRKLLIDAPPLSPSQPTERSGKP